jgi:hypothetical protein
MHLARPHERGPTLDAVCNDAPIEKAVEFRQYRNEFIRGFDTYIGLMLVI